MPKNLHVGTSYSNCRKSKTNKNLEKKARGGKTLSYRGARIRVTSVFWLETVQEERKVKYFKY